MADVGVSTDKADIACIKVGGGGDNGETSQKVSAAHDPNSSFSNHHDWRALWLVVVIGQVLQ